MYILLYGVHPISERPRVLGFPTRRRIHSIYYLFNLILYRILCPKNNTTSFYIILYVYYTRRPPEDSYVLQSSSLFSRCCFALSNNNIIIIYIILFSSLGFYHPFDRRRVFVTSSYRVHRNVLIVLLRRISIYYIGKHSSSIIIYYVLDYENVHICYTICNIYIYIYSFITINQSRVEYNIG